MSRRGSASPSMSRRFENSDRESSSDEEDTVAANVRISLTKSEAGIGSRSGSKNDVDNSPDDSGTSSRNSEADGSFVGKIRSNFSSMLNSLLPVVRQTKQDDSESAAPRQHTGHQSDEKIQALLSVDGRKRPHSPKLAADSEDAGSSYTRTYEMVTKRPRLRETAEKKPVKSTRTSSDAFRSLAAPSPSNINRRLTGFLGNSVYRKRMQQLRSGFVHKTLFGSSHLKSTNSASDTVASSRRPSFNSSAAKISKSLSTGWIPPEYGGSSFYEGLTRFGGASSARTLATHGPPRPTVTVLMKKSHPTKASAPYPMPVALNETKVEKNVPPMSYPAQRILEIMDEYAAKSPASKRELVAQSTKNLRTPSTLQMLNIIRMNERERSEETVQTPTPLPKLPPPPPTVPLMEYTLPLHVDKSITGSSPMGKQDSTTKSAGGKQITKKTRLHADPIQERDETTVEPIQLPNLKLPPLIEGLPKFDFTVPMKGPLLPADKDTGLKNAKSVNDETAKQSEKERSASSAAPSIVPEMRTFKFTSPMVFGGSSRATNSDHAVPDLSAPEPSIPFMHEVNKFVFASPTLFDDLSQVGTTVNPVAPVSHTSPPTTPEPALRDERTFVFTSPQVLGSPSELTDTILTLASSITFTAPEPLEEVSKVRSFKELMADSASKWACDVCMIRNEPHQQTCVACESPKPAPVPTKPKEQTLPAGTNSGSFAAIVSAQSNKWECAACSVRNDSTASVCVCCATEKPTKIDNSGSFAAIVSAQSNRWECSACSVRNDATASVCVCCSTEKPTKSTNSGSFAAIVNAQSNKWECSACSVRNDATASVCVCCSTDKPTKSTNSGSFATIVSAQSNKWECSACSVRNDSAASVCVCCSTEKPTKTGSSGSFATIVSTQSNRWECPACCVRNDPTASVCVCCATGKPK